MYELGQSILIKACLQDPQGFDVAWGFLWFGPVLGKVLNSNKQMWSTRIHAIHTHKHAFSIYICIRIRVCVHTLRHACMILVCVYAYVIICHHMSSSVYANKILRDDLSLPVFSAGSRRWWNLVDSLSLSMLLAALLEGSRSLGNLSAMIRVGRIMRLARREFREGLRWWMELCWKPKNTCWHEESLTFCLQVLKLLNQESWDT